MNLSSRDLYSAWSSLFSSSRSSALAARASATSLSCWASCTFMRRSLIFLLYSSSCSKEPCWSSLWAFVLDSMWSYLVCSSWSLAAVSRSSRCSLRISSPSAVLLAHLALLAAAMLLSMSSLTPALDTPTLPPLRRLLFSSRSFPSCFSALMSLWRSLSTSSASLEEEREELAAVTLPVKFSALKESLVLEAIFVPPLLRASCSSRFSLAQVCPRALCLASNPLFSLWSLALRCGDRQRW